MAGDEGSAAAPQSAGLSRDIRPQAGRSMALHQTETFLHLADGCASPLCINTKFSVLFATCCCPSFGTLYDVRNFGWRQVETGCGKRAEMKTFESGRAGRQS